MHTVPVPTAFIDGTLNFVAVSSAFAKRASDDLAVHEQQQQKAAELRPALLTYLVDAGLVEPAAKQAVDAMLGSHPETLNLLKAAAERLVKAEQELAKRATLGKAASDRDGLGHDRQDDGTTYDSLKDPFLGRRTTQKKASDLALAGILDDP